MRRILYIFILVSFLSCEKEIFNPVEEFEPYIVVNSIISTDSTYAVNLTYSKSIYDRDDFKPVEDAKIFIAVKDEGNIRQEFTLDYQGNGLYTRNNNPAEGKIYELLIEVDGQELRAETYVPRVVEASINVTSTQIDEELDQQALSVEITLSQEDEQNQNFYAWEIEEIIDEIDSSVLGNEQTHTSDTSSENTTDNSTTSPEDGQTLSSETSEDSKPTLLLRNNGLNITSPDDISNGSFTASFVTTTDDAGSDTQVGGGPSSTSTSQVSKPKYKLRVWAISPDYYLYLTSLENTGQPTSDNNPPGLYSNIRNTSGGEVSGIFAGYNVKEYFLEF